jgi:hypothetical protein
VQGAILFGPTDYEFIADVSKPSTDPTETQSFTSLTNADVAGVTELVITYSVTRASLDPGDSWFTVGVNASGSEKPHAAVDSDLGALTRTRTDVENTYNNAHQFFQDYDRGGNLVSSAAALFTNAGNAVRLTISIPTGFTGVSTAIFEVDEGTTTFSSADAMMTQTIDWDRTPGTASFTGMSYFRAHSVQDFTITSVPEPSTILAGLAATGLVLGHRPRALA